MDPREARLRSWLADLIYPEGKRERIAREEQRAATQEQTRGAFHMLWSNAVGTPDYKKSDWKEFMALLRTLGVDL